jgi:hypothetical protein
VVEITKNLREGDRATAAAANVLWQLLFFLTVHDWLRQGESQELSYCADFSLINFKNLVEIAYPEFNLD